MLVIFAGVVLCVVVISTLPGQFGALRALHDTREDWKQRIDEHQRLAQDKDVIQSRLAAVERRALASMALVGNQAESRYRFWLEDLATGVGLNVTLNAAPSSTIAVRGDHGYSRHTFSITVEGRLEQIAEFLRQFHRTEYLHTIQTVRLRAPNAAGVLSGVQFIVEALSLPQITHVNMPNTEGIVATEEEMNILATISNRAILSEFRPAPPPITPPQPEPEIQVIDGAAFCFVTAFTEVDGRPQVWINHRVEGNMHRLFEGEFFVLGGVRCSILEIDMEYQRIVVDIDGRLASLRVNQQFQQVADHAFLVAIEEVDGRPQVWIENRSMDAMLTHVEGESFTFMWCGFRYTILQIDRENQRILVLVEQLDEFGNLVHEFFIYRVGQHFDQGVEVSME